MKTTLQVITKTVVTHALILSTIVIPAEASWGASNELNADEVAVVRSVIKADRQQTVASALQLTEAEAQAFWPLYRQYRAEMDKIGDEILKLTQEYAGYYPEVPEDRARAMLKVLTGLQKKHVATRTKFLKKFHKVLPDAKNLRFAQVESRLDLVLQLKLAAGIPLVPIEGRIPGERRGAVVTAEGVAGGVVVRTFRLSATVIGINKASRKLSLLSEDGIKQTVAVGPDAINFNQIRAGDRVNVEATEELVVSVARPDDAVRGGTAEVVTLAPKGAKPGGVLAEVTQVTAKITALDPQRRSASLRFEDGSSRTVTVRPDVDLSKYRPGDKVVFSLTEMVAIRVQKQ
jgi:hypothetical protein